jgi:hypothetical protein
LIGIVDERCGVVGEPTREDVCGVFSAELGKDALAQGCDYINCE